MLFFIFSFLLFSLVILLFDALTGKALGDGKHLTHKVGMTLLLTPLMSYSLS